MYLQFILYTLLAIAFKPTKKGFVMAVAPLPAPRFIRKTQLEVNEYRKNFHQNDSFAVPEVLDTNINPRAPKSGADQVQVDKIPSELTPRISANQLSNAKPCTTTMSQTESALSMDEIVTRLRAELEPAMQTAARNAAAREHERTREWSGEGNTILDSPSTLCSYYALPLHPR